LGQNIETGKNPSDPIYQLCIEFTGGIGIFGGAMVDIRELEMPVCSLDPGLTLTIGNISRECYVRCFGTGGNAATPRDPKWARVNEPVS
jgi:hypothetical protein